jgi:phytoene synthase
MVDAWEILVTTQHLGQGEVEAFGTQRGAFFAALAGEDASDGDTRVTAAAFRWAVADAAVGVSDPDERLLLIPAGPARGDRHGPMPKDLRGLAVLDALATRALRRGGCALMEGRGAPLAALRGAIFLS